MRLSRALRMTRDTLYDAGRRDWDVRVSNAYRYCGKAEDWSQTITLSRMHTLLGTDADVTDTIRHEVAHAIVGTSHGHDSVWRATATALGAAPG